MVFFTCNHCGDALKKQAVEKHGWKCRKEIHVSCMDCNKDFGKDYDGHTSCVSELERYSGKDFIPKANANKGAKKQEAWIDTIRSITANKTNITKGVKDVFNIIAVTDNIPRKQKGFFNFFSNSHKYIKKYDIEHAWNLLDEEVKKSRLESQQQKDQNPPNGTVNGETNGKRKHEDAEENEPKSKKKKIEVNGETTNDTDSLVPDGDDDEKFKWSEIIKHLLQSKSEGIKLGKLKKKVLKKYKSFTGKLDISDKIERKFSKKVARLGVVDELEVVRLIQ